MSDPAASELAHPGNNRHLLLAVDESDSSRRAVMYVADFFGDYKDIDISLLSIVAEPSEDYFPSDAARRQWLEEKKRLVAGALEEYRKILAGAGLREDRIETRLSIRQCPSIGDAILEEQDKLRCCIVVLGRRALTHDEEFIYGSTSSRVLHNAKHCAVMVVE